MMLMRSQSLILKRRSSSTEKSLVVPFWIKVITLSWKRNNASKESLPKRQTNYSVSLMKKRSFKCSMKIKVRVRITAAASHTRAKMEADLQNLHPKINHQGTWNRQVTNIVSPKPGFGKIAKEKIWWKIMTNWTCTQKRRIRAALRKVLVTHYMTTINLGFKTRKLCSIILKTSKRSKCRSHQRSKMKVGLKWERKVLNRQKSRAKITKSLPIVDVRRTIMRMSCFRRGRWRWVMTPNQA